VCKGGSRRGREGGGDAQRNRGKTQNKPDRSTSGGLAGAKKKKETKKKGEGAARMLKEREEGSKRPKFKLVEQPVKNGAV